MGWIVILGIIALGIVTLALIKKSRRSTQNLPLKEINDSTKAIKSDLFKLQFTENAENYGERVFQQFEELEKKYNSYLQTLNQKFNPTEVTYDRYLNPVQQVKSSLSENLMKLKDITIYIGNNAGQIKELIKKDSTLLATEEKSKLEIDKKYKSYFEEIHTINQKALNELDHLTLSLTQVNSTQSDPKQIEYLVKELTSLADRAKKYNLT